MFLLHQIKKKQTYIKKGLNNIFLSLKDWKYYIYKTRISMTSWPRNPVDPGPRSGYVLKKNKGSNWHGMTHSKARVDLVKA
jgi:hypothetical protein